MAKKSKQQAEALRRVWQLPSHIAARISRGDLSLASAFQWQQIVQPQALRPPRDPTGTPYIGSPTREI